MNIDKVLTKVFGSSNERFLKTIRPLIAQINEFEPQVQKLSDEQLRERTAEYKTRIADAVKDARDKDDRKYREQEVLNEILPEAFALVREASMRTTGMRHFDVQMIGGIVLHQGKIAEMRTGEGKTLVATLPVYLNALTGRGVHVITVNDYLAASTRRRVGRRQEDRRLHRRREESFSRAHGRRRRQSRASARCRQSLRSVEHGIAALRRAGVESAHALSARSSVRGPGWRSNH